MPTPLRPVVMLAVISGQRDTRQLLGLRRAVLKGWWWSNPPSETMYEKSVVNKKDQRTKNKNNELEPVLKMLTFFGPGQLWTTHLATNGPIFRPPISICRFGKDGGLTRVLHLRGKTSVSFLKCEYLPPPPILSIQPQPLFSARDLKTTL